MGTWIWHDHPVSLRVAVVVTSILFLLLAAGWLLSWSASSGSWIEPSLACLFAVSSYGLLRLKTWARWVTVVILWILIFVLIGGIFNPYLASDMMSLPSVASLLTYIVPAVVAIVWVLHILGKYKRLFE